MVTAWTLSPLPFCEPWHYVPPVGAAERMGRLFFQPSASAKSSNQPAGPLPWVKSVHVQAVPTRW
jgi:hypothetical protein